METTGRPRQEDRDQIRGSLALSLTQSLREQLRREAQRRQLSMGKLAEQWMRDGMTLDPHLAHLSSETGTNRAS